MKYTILENAIISLDIAVSNFRMFYYNEKYIQKSKYYEHMKISMLFLENAIELLLKSILIKDDKSCIYKEEDKNKIFYNVSLEMSSRNKIKLEDILISNTHIQTLSYGQTLNLYCNRYNNSEKLRKILRKLGNFRNSITHFGIHTSDVNIICCFIETFDVIYNYLYPQLISLDDDANYYFNSYDIFVKTPHGIKYLIDKEGKYQSFIDFLDELLVDCTQNYIMTICSDCKSRNIHKFLSICNKLVLDKEIINLTSPNDIYFDFFDNSEFYSIHNNNELLLYPYYSSFYNASIYTTGYEIIFIVEHYSNKIYQYLESVNYPCLDEAENDKQWLSDKEKGYCIDVDLNEINLKSILLNWLTSTLKKSIDY